MFEENGNFSNCAEDANTSIAEPDESTHWDREIGCLLAYKARAMKRSFSNRIPHNIFIHISDWIIVSNVQMRFTYGAIFSWKKKTVTRQAELVTTTIVEKNIFQNS